MEFIENYWVFILFVVLLFCFALFAFNQIRMLINIQREQIRNIERERTTTKGLR